MPIDTGKHAYGTFGPTLESEWLQMAVMECICVNYLCTCVRVFVSLFLLYASLVVGLQESDSDDSYWSESETESSSDSDARGAAPGEYPYTISYFLKKRWSSDYQCRKSMCVVCCVEKEM